MIEELQPELRHEPAPVQRAQPRISLSERLEIAPRRFLLLFTAIYLFAEYCGNRRKAFWIDEIYTYTLADLPSIKNIWPLIRQGIELNPPLPFWITWVVHHTIGKGEFLTRLPSILGFWGMCLCLFYYVKRRSDATHGFIALLIPLFTYTAWDATSARGYGLLLGFSAAAMLCWQLATDNVRRALVLPALSVSLAGALSCHYYGLYSAGAIAVGELVRTWRKRRIDTAIFAAILLGASLIFVYLPLLKAVAAGSKNFWIKPMMQFFYGSYADLFGPAAMVLLLFLLAVLNLRGNKAAEEWAPATLGIHETAACLAFAAMPLTFFVGSQFTPLAFYSRYVQEVVIGFTIAIVMFAYRVGGWNPAFRKLTISLAIWLCFVPWTLWHVIQAFFPEPWTVTQGRLHIPEKQSLPIVIDNDYEFMVAYHYAPKEVREHLFFLYNPSSAIRYLGTDTGQKSLFVGQTFSDFHLVGYGDFLRREHEFLVLRPQPSGWVLQRLLEDKANIQLVQLNKERGTFVEDRLLFHVSVPNPK